MIPETDPLILNVWFGTVRFRIFLRHRTIFTTLVILLWMLLPGCISLGPKRIPVDSFNYNEVISKASNEQMLLNLVRLRYREVPVFLAVGSLITQYFYVGNVSANATIGKELSETVHRFGANGRILYAERPTITYSPLSGSEFSQQLLTPIPKELVFALAQSGWTPDQLLTMCLERLNHIENLHFRSVTTQERLEGVSTFQHMVELIVDLSRRRAIEMQRDNGENSNARYLVFEQNPDADTQVLIDELKRILGLDPHYSSYSVTERLIRRKPDEVTIRIRSLLDLMGYLSRGVEVPAEHVVEKQADKMACTIDEDVRSQLFPLRISSQSDRPRESFVAVQHHDHWFYISHSDHLSKEAFSLLTYLFLMQAPQPQTMGPMLTVPTSQ